MAEADDARQEQEARRLPEQQGCQPPPAADDHAPPAVPAPAPEPTQPASTNPSSSANLMRTVIIILGIALFLLIVFDGIAVLENKTNDDLNSLVSLIAGGFVGYLTPHVTNAVKGSGGDQGDG